MKELYRIKNSLFNNIKNIKKIINPISSSYKQKFVSKNKTEKRMLDYEVSFLFSQHNTASTQKRVEAKLSQQTQLLLEIGEANHSQQNTASTQKRVEATFQNE